MTMRQNGNSISFYWKSLDCELCKEVYPNNILLEGKYIDLIEIPKPDTNFIILEALTGDRQANRGLHLISLQNQSTIKMGRGHDSDIRISDISVSRTHAVINMCKGNFYLEDHMSKFGTLVQIKRPIIIDVSSNFALQIGRTVVTFSLKKAFSIIPSCFSCCNDSSDQIQQQIIQVEKEDSVQGAEGLMMENDDEDYYDNQQERYEEAKQQDLHDVQIQQGEQPQQQGSVSPLVPVNFHQNQEQQMNLNVQSNLSSYNSPQYTPQYGSFQGQPQLSLTQQWQQYMNSEDQAAQNLSQVNQHAQQDYQHMYNYQDQDNVLSQNASQRVSLVVEMERNEAMYNPISLPVQSSEQVQQENNNPISSIRSPQRNASTRLIEDYEIMEIEEIVPQRVQRSISSLPQTNVEAHAQDTQNESQYNNQNEAEREEIDTEFCF